jgi:aspartyl-tRNA(Asn)/glutamyl-tRNA(Gln) amidotransferase subunit A
MSKLAEMTAHQLKALLERRETSCVEIMQSVLGEIRAREAEVHAFITVREEADLLREAAAVDARRQRGERVGPLAGLPVAVKDNMCTAGLRTTAGSRLLENFVPPYDATAIQRLRAADGILLGKTNLDEFSMGSSTENSAYGPTRNPRDLTRVPGGTSGGSAAAVAANMAILALGSDTGGSIRQPASFCGVVGMKPTYGRVSRYGLIAYGSSLDQIGPIAKSVEDAALLLSVISGHDRMDSTSLDLPATAAQIAPAKGQLRIGVPKEYFGDGLAAEVRTAIHAALARMEKDGHRLVDVSLPHSEYAIPTYYLIACAEASANLARYDGVRYGRRAAEPRDLLEMYVRSREEGFGEEVKRRILLGTFTLSAGYSEAYYLRAQKVRTLIRRDFEQAFEKCDVVASPVAPTTAFKLGEKTADPLAMYLGDIYSVTANLTGLPAISIPLETNGGLPVGLQFTTRAGSDGSLLDAWHSAAS